jgi:voltage-gated potassium channel
LQEDGVRARDRYNTFIERHEAAWELTFALLALFFVVIGVWPLDPATANSPALVGLEWTITAVFAAEFVSRLGASYDRRSYLRGHWIDAVALIPVGRGLRLFRLVRLLRLVRAFAGIARALDTVERIANHRALIWVGTAWVAVMVICSAGFFAAESDINPAIREPLDAVWWGITTMTTVGYGDVYPITHEGRLAGAVLMILGIGLYSAITATLTSQLVSKPALDPLSLRLRELSAARRDGEMDDRELRIRVDELMRFAGAEGPV